MKRTASVVTVLLFALAISAGAIPFTVSIQKGAAEIIRSGTGEQSVISDTGTLSSGDAISLSEGQLASVAIEKNAAVLLKGPCNGTFSLSGSQLLISLDDGQILLNRKKPYELSQVTITAKGFSFVPMGTCAAVKTAKDAQPTTAVVAGKMRMQSPSGAAIVVDKGSYGSVGSDGAPTSGALSPRAVESLNEWAASVPVSGTESESAPGDASGTTPAPAAAAPAGSPPAATPAPVSGDKGIAATEPQKNTEASGDNAAGTPAAAAAPAKEKGDAGKEQPAAEEDAKKEKPGARKVDKTPAPPSSPQWEISAGTATVDGEQWTRLAIGVDVPIWKFGVFFDVELFVDNDGQFSDKGWNFEDDWLDALSRKIRYIRFGQEGEPLFIKFGGLSSVSLGYGFLVDRFTNMLHYPDQKLLGLQFDLNDISPIGITLQTLVADFKDFNNDGGVVAARLGFRPLKITGIPVVKGITISGSYATDLNQYAPARKWDFTMNGEIDDMDQDGIKDSGWVRDFYQTGGGTFDNQTRDNYLTAGQYDTIIEHRDQWASRETDPFGLIGADIGIPIITTSLVGLDLYGQGGIRDDGRHGWGIGAPGVSLKVWRLWANVEYRHVQGMFQPGYFGTYYLDERLLRDPEITTKESRLADDTLNGVFGRLGFNIADVLLIEGSYQYMIGQREESKDQRFEAVGSLGELVLSKIPKLNRAEVYYYKSRIGNDSDAFFEKTPFMYFGYRAGFEIAAGASLIWDARYGFKHDENDNLVANNNISIQTAITF